MLLTVAIQTLTAVTDGRGWDAAVEVTFWREKLAKVRSLA